MLEFPFLEDRDHLQERFEVLAHFDFTSDRKRQSVVVRRLRTGVCPQPLFPESSTERQTQEITYFYFCLYFSILIVWALCVCRRDFLVLQRG